MYFIFIFKTDYLQYQQSVNIEVIYNDNFSELFWGKVYFFWEKQHLFHRSCSKCSNAMRLNYTVSLLK